MERIRWGSFVIWKDVIIWLYVPEDRECDGSFDDPVRMAYAAMQDVLGTAFELYAPELGLDGTHSITVRRIGDMIHSN